MSLHRDTYVNPFAKECDYTLIAGMIMCLTNNSRHYIAFVANQYAQFTNCLKLKRAVGFKLELRVFLLNNHTIFKMIVV